MSVTFPRGFRAAGVTAGFKPSGQPDLAMLIGDAGTAAAGLFTTNRVVAAPVELSRARLATGRPRAVVVNSGQANAATGERGDRDAAVAADAAARLAGLDPEEMVACSTGVIGEPLHIEPLLEALPALVGEVGKGGGDVFARAILTTDTVDKQAIAQARAVRVGGCAKGVGMIAPNLATMLAFVTTDASVLTSDLQRLADEQLRSRFNALTVDGCTSTNDTVLLFASGAAGEAPARPGTAAWSDLEVAVARVADSLVSQLIHDAEGVTKVMLVDVGGAAADVDARRVARAVADSPLVKTAVFGMDPNPGRILQAVGASGVDVDPSKLDISIGDVPVATGGVIPPAYFADAALRRAAVAAMQQAEVRLSVCIGAGPGRARTFGCDLSYGYVRINGEYTT